jgi:hypothetical protein
VTPIWRKSSHSGSVSEQTDCVEVASLPSTVGIRDSKSPRTGHLAISTNDFAILLTKVKRGDLDL